MGANVLDGNAVSEFLHSTWHLAFIYISQARIFSFSPWICSQCRRIAKILSNGEHEQTADFTVVRVEVYSRGIGAACMINRSGQGHSGRT